MNDVQGMTLTALHYDDNERESSSLFYIKKVEQLDYPDNGFKSTKLTGPGQDIGRRAGNNYNSSVRWRLEGFT